MKEKVLVRISVPMADIASDVRVPYDLSSATVADMAAEMFRKTAEERLPISPTPVLWFVRGEMLLEDSKSLREQGITDSDMLLLI